MSRRVGMLKAGLMLTCACALVLGAGTPAGAATPAVAAVASARAAEAGRPNIVVILADDLGYADVSTYFKGRFQTPNIDRLGREGAVFTQGYVTAPVCAPSRAGLLTGRQDQRYGFEYLPDGAPRAAREHLGLSVGEKTIADLLHQDGYHTGLIGKWHLGMTDEFYPTRRGFDEFWGFLPGQTNYIVPTAPDAVNGVDPVASNVITGDLEQPRMVTPALNAIYTGPDRQKVDVGDGYLTDQLTDHAADFIERNKSQPFFLYLAYNAPHTPLQATKKYYDRFPQIADKRIRTYAAMISALDDGVGRVLDAIDKAGVAKDTIVVFLSDNGCAGYIPGLCSAEPLSGSKLTQLEGGVRVPFMMRYPAMIRPGTVETRSVSSLDLLPTFLAAAGAKLPADRVFDGVDILPRKAGGPLAVPERRELFWRDLPLRALHDGDWKYMQDYDGKEYLYNIRSDPRELVNLAEKEPVRLKAMRAEYAHWEADKKPPSWTSGAKLVEFDFGGRHFKFVP